MRVSIISTSPIQVRKNQLRSGEYSMPVNGQNLQANLTFKGEKWPDEYLVGDQRYVVGNLKIIEEEKVRRNMALKALNLNDGTKLSEIVEALEDFILKTELNYLIKATKLEPDSNAQTDVDKIKNIKSKLSNQERFKNLWEEAQEAVKVTLLKIMGISEKVNPENIILNEITQKILYPPKKFEFSTALKSIGIDIPPNLLSQLF